MLRRFSYRVVLTLMLAGNLAFGPTVLVAQENPTDIPAITIRSNTRLVMVDVVVTNKNGQPVTGLKAEDFTLEENGKKQRVSIFVPPGIVNRTAPTPPPAGVLSNLPENLSPQGVPTVLLLDAMNSPFKDQAYARSQMLKYVLEQAQIGRPIAILTLTDQLHVLQQFTSDPQVLATAIKNLRPQEQILQSSGPENLLLWPQILDGRRQNLRVAGELLKHMQLVGESQDCDWTADLRLFQHVLQHLRTGIRLVLKGGVHCVQQQHGGHALRAQIFGEVRKDAGWRRSRSGAVDNARGNENGNPLFLSVLLKREILSFQSRDRLAVLVGHHHVDHHETCVRADGDCRNVRRIFLGN